MAYRDYRVVCFVPYGRKKTASILLKYFLQNKDLIDEVWLCMNTDDDQVEDRAYADTIADGTFIKKVELPADEVRLEPKQFNTGKFYRYMNDPGTIYLRFDDDIVYVDDNYFRNILDFRIDNPQYFVVFGNIWNNAICGWVDQHITHNLSTEYGEIEEPFAMDMVAWMSPTYAEYVHTTLLAHIKDQTVAKLYYDRYELTEPQRFSVSNFAIFGADLDAQNHGDLGGQEEESWLTEIRPRELGRFNVVCGNAIVSHFAFFAQRPHLEANTDILSQYQQVAKQNLSRDYYRLLNDANHKAS